MKKILLALFVLLGLLAVAPAHNVAMAAELTPEQIIAVCNQALAANPKYAEVYNNRGNAYMDLGHYEEALRNYEKALSLNPGLTEAQQNIEMIRNVMR